MEELVYDLDTGEMISKEEHLRREEQRQMAEIGEGDEDEYDDEEGDDKEWGTLWIMWSK